MTISYHSLSLLNAIDVNFNFRLLRQVAQKFYILIMSDRFLSVQVGRGKGGGWLGFAQAVASSYKFYRGTADTLFVS